jgi:hypothetical protein
MQILLNCIDERRLQMLLSSGIINTPPHSPCPKNQELQKEYRYVAEFIEQCPILDDFVHTRLGLSFPWKTYVTLDSALLTNWLNVLFCGKVESLLCSRNAQNVPYLKLLILIGIRLYL